MPVVSPLVLSRPPKKIPDMCMMQRVVCCTTRLATFALRVEAKMKILFREIERPQMILNFRRAQIRRLLPWAALALFVLSLFSPAVSQNDDPRLDYVCKAPIWSWGLDMFLIGPIGIFFKQFGWISNPLMLSAALMKTCISCLLAAVSVALIVATAFSFTSIWHDRGGDVIVCGFGLGYHLWLASSILVLVVALLKPVRRCSAPKSSG
jgi:hypothetical protein